MSIKLSICIPTYNRAELLRECLASVVPQLHGRDDVELIVSDNASPDHTPAVVADFHKKCEALRYYRNESNLGYTGNQIKCFEHALGEYLAILCDDDLYMPGIVDEILRVLNGGEYALVALNYFGFRNIQRPSRTEFVSVKDVYFKRAYDVINYPSVGHYSGYVFNLKLSQKILHQMLSGRELKDFEKLRGIFIELAARTTATTDLPAFFIGARGMAARMPETVDYDSINHLCLDYYQCFYALYKEGLITQQDLNITANIVLNRFPRAIVTDTYYMSVSEIMTVIDKCNYYFKNNIRLWLIIRPLLLLSRYNAVKKIFKMSHKFKRYIKYNVIN